MVQPLVLPERVAGVVPHSVLQRPLGGVEVVPGGAHHLTGLAVLHAGGVVEGGDELAVTTVVS